MNITTTVGYTGGLDPSALGRLEEAIANYDPQFVPINLVMYELGEQEAVGKVLKLWLEGNLINAEIELSKEINFNYYVAGYNLDLVSGLLRMDNPRGDYFMEYPEEVRIRKLYERRSEVKKMPEDEKGEVKDGSYIFNTGDIVQRKSQLAQDLEFNKKRLEQKTEATVKLLEELKKFRHELDISVVVGIYC